MSSAWATPPASARTRRWSSDRIGNLPKAAVVAEALGVRSVTSEPDPNLFVDVTVMLGAEWSAPEQEPEGSGRILDWLRQLVGRQ